MFEFIAENFFTVGTIVGLLVGFIIGVLYETTNTRRLENELNDILEDRLIVDDAHEPFPGRYMRELDTE